MSRRSRRRNWRFLNCVASRLGRQADELQSRLEFSLHPFKSLELEADRLRCRPPAETLQSDALE